jgi:hypothetical protein
MPRLLEDLQSGTVVRAANGEPVGEVRAVYALGDTRAAAYLLVYWSRRGEQALLNTDEVSTITSEGVVLRSNGSSYADLPAFDPSANPMLHRL